MGVAIAYPNELKLENIIPKSSDSIEIGIRTRKLFQSVLLLGQISTRL